MSEPKKVALTSEELQEHCAGYIEQFRKDFPGIGMFVKDLKELEAENARLKAEVESIRKYWKATGEGVNRYVGKSIALEDEVARLKAEVERLTKAGDAMASILQFEERLYHDQAQDPKSVKDWNAAKGVQS